MTCRNTRNQLTKGRGQRGQNKNVVRGQQQHLYTEQIISLGATERQTRVVTLTGKKKTLVSDGAIQRQSLEAGNTVSPKPKGGRNSKIDVLSIIQQ